MKSIDLIASPPMIKFPTLFRCQKFFPMPSRVQSTLAGPAKSKMLNREHYTLDGNNLCNSRQVSPCLVSCSLVHDNLMENAVDNMTKENTSAINNFRMLNVRNPDLVKNFWIVLIIAVGLKVFGKKHSAGKFEVACENSIWMALEDSLIWLGGYVVVLNFISRMLPDIVLISETLLRASLGVFSMVFLYFLHWPENRLLLQFFFLSGIVLVLYIGDLQQLSVESLLIGGIDIISGLYLMFKKYFSVGSYVKVGVIEGKVLLMGVTRVKLVDAKGSINFVRNSEFVKKEIGIPVKWHKMKIKIKIHEKDRFKMIEDIEELVTKRLGTEFDEDLSECACCFQTKVEGLTAELTLRYTLKSRGFLVNKQTLSMKYI